MISIFFVWISLEILFLAVHFAAALSGLLYLDLLILPAFLGKQPAIDSLLICTFDCFWSAFLFPSSHLLYRASIWYMVNGLSFPNLCFFWKKKAKNPLSSDPLKFSPKFLWAFISLFCIFETSFTLHAFHIFDYDLLNTWNSLHKGERADLYKGFYWGCFYYIFPSHKMRDC